MQIYINIFGLPNGFRYFWDLCYPLAKKAGITQDITIDFMSVNYEGRKVLGEAFISPGSWLFHCYIDKNLDYPFTINNIFTKQTIGGVIVYSQEEFIKYIMAHEFCHATYGHCDNFLLPNRSETDRFAMELCCDSFALAATGIRN